MANRKTLFLAIYINNTHSNWDDILPYITFAYNSSVQESTGRTPFYLLYGREARLPVDVVMGVHAGAGTSDPKTLTRNLEIARVEVRHMLKQVQEKQKQLYDAKRRLAPEFEPGEEVLVYKPIRKVGRSEKLLHRWLGPYVVVQRKTALNYVVKRQIGKQLELVHDVKMKRFIKGGEWTVGDSEVKETDRSTEGTTTKSVESKYNDEGTVGDDGSEQEDGREEQTDRADKPRETPPRIQQEGSGAGAETQGRRSTRTRRAPHMYG